MKKSIHAFLMLLMVLALYTSNAAAEMIIVEDDYNIDKFLNGTDLMVIFPTERKLHLRRLEATPGGIRFCVSSERGHRLWLRDNCYYEDWDMLDYLKVWKRARIIFRKNLDPLYHIYTIQDLKDLVFRRSCSVPMEYR